MCISLTISAETNFCMHLLNPSRKTWHKVIFLLSITVFNLEFSFFETVGVVAIEKGAFGSPSTMVANFTYFTYYSQVKELSLFSYIPIAERKCIWFIPSSSTHFSSICPIDRTLSGATTPGQSGPGCDGNEGVLRISDSSCITGTSPLDC